MKLHLSGPPSSVLKSTINITGSKSESNRLLLLQALYPNITIENTSNSDDAQVMQKGLRSTDAIVDIHHAGTAMRFLTAYFAARNNKKITLTGSERMHQRPIKVLVEALRELGAKIEYLQDEGCPPLAIEGRLLEKNEVSLPANISSQYISALLLIAPSLPKGLELELVGSITSIPYIKMTLSLLDQIGITNTFEGNRIKISPKSAVSDKKIIVESDWSSASYFYSIAALSDIGTKLSLSSYKRNSLQGDSVLAEIYEQFGVKTEFKDNSIVLTRVSKHQQSTINLDLSNAPDLAQTIAVSCFGLGISCELSGLHTLKIKETDRLEALKTELSKLGATISVTKKSLSLEQSDEITSGVTIDTYNDHRMAMAFAPLALKTALTIAEAEVVSKSYPDFWQDLQILGFSIKKI